MSTITNSRIERLICYKCKTQSKITIKVCRRCKGTAFRFRKAKA